VYQASMRAPQKNEPQVIYLLLSLDRYKTPKV